MIAWLALVLSSLSILFWVLAVIAIRKVAEQVRPFLSMMGFGSTLASSSVSSLSTSAEPVPLSSDPPPAEEPAP